MPFIDHVAILVDSVEDSLKRMRAFGFYHGEIDVFPGEGTKEVYIGQKNQIGRLLLVEAISDGPYRKAYNSRGAGLHHIAINVNSFDEYLKRLEASGWYLHLHSWKSQKHQTLWLARAGLPILIELHETQEESLQTDSFIKSIQWDYSGNERLIERLGLTELKKGKDMLFKTEKHILSLSDIL